MEMMTKNNEIEEWKDIPGYENRYQASTFGNIKSILRSGRILKQFQRGDYVKVELHKDGKQKSFNVHQLIAITFLNHIIGSELVINHINEIKIDNRLINLEIITSRNNRRYSINKENTTSSFFGVSWCKSSKKWKSQITINKRNIYLGVYNTELEASEAYNNKLKEITNGNS